MRSPLLAVISPDRRYERGPFLARSPLRDLGRLRFAFPALRQGLYQWLGHVPPGRVLMPDYVPEGVYGPFERRGWQVAFYPLLPSLEIDTGALRRAGPADIAVLIHQFGLYIQHNVDAVREASAGKGLVLEDFAHTLWDSRTVLSGDLCGFSFTKSLGVADGSLLWLRNRSLLHPCTCTADTAGDRRLKTLLGRRLLVEHLLATICRRRTCHGPLLRATRRWCDYYSHLSAAYTGLAGPISPASLRTLDHLDMDRVSTARRALADRYVERLNPALMFDLPRDSFLRQSLFAFPVRVPDRESFVQHMSRHGVRTTVLTDRWWWRNDAPPGDTYRSHCLLPLTHYLSVEQVDRVIDAANQWLRVSVSP